MLKLQSLALGLITAAIYTPHAQANSFPERFSFLNAKGKASPTRSRSVCLRTEATPTTHNSFNRELHAQVVKPLKKSIPAQQPKLEKVPLKTRKYPEVRMQPSSSSNQLECDRLHRLDQSGSLPPNMTVKTSITFGQPIDPTCATVTK
ncbi:hypothetical protein [Chamaesiphon sp. VAR_69_metabat_338]|uniref:hypothetical protein n=1 Tax=Chamaesiphon sp. VAR_69_metabat_338 TaxID=2964704 RepID=UPI00286EA281|nr:hypothetical protein [Chamaesiphon sp. VAR_69_metabat_338]